MSALYRKENKVYIDYEPFESLERFSLLCIEALNVLGSDIEIIVDDEVTSLPSSYIGSMISMKILAEQMGKEIKIRCSSSLRKWFRMIGGTKVLELVVEE